MKAAEREEDGRSESAYNISEGVREKEEAEAHPYTSKMSSKNVV